MSTLDGSPLGKATAYPDRYDPSLLFAIPRSQQRDALGLREPLPFSGTDIWTAYELSWLDTVGKPRIAIGEFRIPADSPSIVESKSLKLYLGSFAQQAFASAAETAQTIEGDLKRACGANVTVTLAVPPWPVAIQVTEPAGESLDTLEVTHVEFDEGPQPDALSASGDETEETLRSSLFRSNCPVTGQPDYADVLVRYAGPRIDRAGLLRYLVSFRRHSAFHEQCVEQIFVDIRERCRSQRLTVYARFLRRGGIDINPFRSNFERAPSINLRVPRQ